MKKLIVIIFALTLISSGLSEACTSAIITGKATPDGRPLLWKNRDTGELNNRIEYFGKTKDIKYAFIALVNSPTVTGSAWTGTNEVGFSIMNTASYNLKEDDIKKNDMEGKVMFMALANCKNLKDFEKMLTKMKRPMGVESNFGVIDAEGGAAYYEVNNEEWRKVDVCDPKIAPQGYLIYTNYSYTGRFNEGMGYIRYTNASQIFLEKIVKNGKITPQWIFNNLSRSFYNSLVDVDLIKNPKYAPKGWYFDGDFIPRRSTAASIVIKGVKKGENPELTIMWTILGYAPVGVAVPLFVKSGEEMPKQFMKRGENIEGLDSMNCQMCDEALARKENVFSIKRGNGKNYFHFSILYNKEGTGYIQKLSPIENKIFETFEPQIEKWYEKGMINTKELSELYQKTDFGGTIK